MAMVIEEKIINKLPWDGEIVKKSDYGGLIGWIFGE